MRCPDARTRGEERLVRSLVPSLARSLARSLVRSGHRGQERVWRGANRDGEQRGCPRTTGRRTTGTHTRDRANDWLVGLVGYNTCVSSAFPFSRQEQGRARSADVRALACTNGAHAHAYARIGAAVRLFIDLATLFTNAIDDRRPRRGSRRDIPVKKKGNIDVEQR